MIYGKPYSWQVYDVDDGFPNEEEDTCTILSWCLDRDSNPLLIRLQNFPLTCYLELPDRSTKGVILWNRRRTDLIIEWLKKYLRGKCSEPTEIKWRKKIPIYFYQLQKSDYLQITFSTMKDMRDFSDLFDESIEVEEDDKYNLGMMKFKVLEAQIDPILKLLTYQELKFADWLQIEDFEEVTDEDFKISTVREFVAQWDTVHPVPFEVSQEWVANPKTLSWDGEMYSDVKRAIPKPLKINNCCFILTAACKRYGVDEEIQKISIVIGDPSDDYTSPEGERLRLEGRIIRVPYGDELALIEAFCQVIQEYDPEVMISYNGFTFDIPFLTTRLDIWLREWPNIGRLRYKKPFIYSTSWESSAYGKQVMDVLRCPGRVSLDLFRIISRENKLPSYSLKAVSEHFLGNMTKLDVSPAQMFEAYEELNDAYYAFTKLKPETPQLQRELTESKYEQARERMALIVAYGLRDSVLLPLLMEKNNVWPTLVELSNVVDMPIEDLYIRGQQQRCFNQIFRLSTHEGIVINEREGAIREFAGGKVQDPIPGLHDDVICLDFASLYPSIIRAYNICFTTLVSQEHYTTVPTDDCHLFDFTQEIEISVPAANQLKKDGTPYKRVKKEKKTIQKPVHQRFVKKEVRQGLLPILLEKLVNQRKAVRRFLDGVKDPQTGEWIIHPEKDPIRKIVLNSRQNALKVSANSVFGFMGVADGKLPLYEGAICTTGKGRELIDIVYKYLQKTYNAIVVYGDTDSLMFQLGIPFEESINDVGRRIAAEVSALFPPPLAMEFEKAMRILCLKKKKYAAFLIGSDGQFKLDKTGKLFMMVKGIMTARRDNFAHARNCYNDLLDSVLQRASLLQAAEHLFEQIGQLLQGNVSIQDLLINRSVGSHYKKDDYMMKILSDELTKIGKPVQTGERLMYVILKQKAEKEKLGYRLRTLDWYEEEGGEIDYLYYLEHGMQAHIDQLFSIGFSEQLQALGDKTYLGRSKIDLRTPVALIIKALQHGYTFEHIRDWALDWYHSICV